MCSCLAGVHANDEAAHALAVLARAPAYDSAPAAAAAAPAAAVDNAVTPARFAELLYAYLVDKTELVLRSDDALPLLTSVPPAFTPTMLAALPSVRRPAECLVLARRAARAVAVRTRVLDVLVQRLLVHTLRALTHAGVVMPRGPAFQVASTHLVAAYVAAHLRLAPEVAVRRAPGAEAYTAAALHESLCAAYDAFVYVPKERTAAALALLARRALVVADGVAWRGMYAVYT